MIKKMSLLKDIVKKIGRKNAMEIISMIEGENPFTMEIKIKKDGINASREYIKLKENQKIVLEYIES